MAISKFYHNHNAIAGERLCIQSLGIHETMAPGIVRHGGPGFPFLFMFFHTPAWLNWDKPDVREAQSGVIIWEPEVLHDYGNPQQAWDHSWLVAHGNAINHAVAKHQLPLNTLLFLGAEKQFVRYLKMLYRELRKRPRQDSYILSEIIALLIYELARDYREEQSLVPENILNAREYIEKKFNQPLTLPDIAKIASLSVPRFIVMFKQCYGEPPIHFLIRTRLERAAQLLIYQHLSIKEIARETGFSDPLYFSRQFSVFFGQSPRQFRLLAKMALAQPSLCCQKE